MASSPMFKCGLVTIGIVVLVVSYFLQSRDEVLSGACQPLLMCELHSAGLGDSRCQLYMAPWHEMNETHQGSVFS